METRKIVRASAVLAVLFTMLLLRMADTAHAHDCEETAEGVNTIHRQGPYHDNNCGAHTPTQSQPRPHQTPCIVKHAATPVQLCEDGAGNGYRLFFIGNGSVASGEYIPISAAEPDPIMGTINPYTGWLVLITWLEDATIRVRTFYADGKPYFFDVSPEGRVIHRFW